MRGERPSSPSTASARRRAVLHPVAAGLGLLLDQSDDCQLRVGPDPGDSRATSRRRI